MQILWFCFCKGREHRGVVPPADFQAEPGGIEELLILRMIDHCKVTQVLVVTFACGLMIGMGHAIQSQAKIIDFK